MGIFGNFVDNPGYLNQIGTYSYHFPKGISITKVFFFEVFGNNNCFWLRKGTFRVTLNHRDRKHLEKIGIDQHDLFFLKTTVAVFYKNRPAPG